MQQLEENAGEYKQQNLHNMIDILRYDGKLSLCLNLALFTHNKERRSVCVSLGNKF